MQEHYGSENSDVNNEDDYPGDPKPITLGRALARIEDNYGMSVYRTGAEVIIVGDDCCAEVFDSSQYDKACAEVMVNPADSPMEYLREQCDQLIYSDPKRAVAAAARYKERYGDELRID